MCNCTIDGYTDQCSDYKADIEEDIERLKEFKEYAQEMLNDMEYERPVDVTINLSEVQAIENILADRERVLEENRALREDYQTENQYYKGEYNALVEKMKDEIENNEWSTKEYDCDTADYKQSQAIGAWNVLIKIKQELIPEEE